MIKLKLLKAVPFRQEDDSDIGTSTAMSYAMLPVILMSIIFFGIGSLEVIAFAIVSSLIFEWMFKKILFKLPVQVFEGQVVVRAILLAFCLPVGLPFWIIPIGSLVLIVVSRLSFDGLKINPFHPVLVGWLLLRIAFPIQMTTWKATSISADAFTGATPLGIVNGKPLVQLAGNLQIPGYFDLFWGNVSGSLGEISALALLIGGFYLLWRKVITWQTPAAIFTTIIVLEGLLWIIAPGHFLDPVFHLITGGIMLGSIFLATDPATSPETPTGKFFFGICIGIITLFIRNFSPFPEGIAFAILVMNGFTTLINKKSKLLTIGRYNQVVQDAP